VLINWQKSLTLMVIGLLVYWLGRIPRKVVKNSLFLGVLTKPDRIPPTEEGEWLPFIRGERENTATWFCVKCPNSQAIKEGITWEQARAAELAFFSSTQPWSTLKDDLGTQLGTEKLTTFLSNKLCDAIEERFVHSRSTLP
jgi:hypothetical protein